jgi:putative flippase GtrA
MTSRLSDKHLLVVHKFVRYSAVSAVSVPVSLALFATFNGLVGLESWLSNALAVTIASIPSYVLNRYWVWGKRGKNHFWREVMPFWLMAVLGLVFSTLLVHVADQFTDWIPALMAANLTAFGLLWVVKFLLLDSLLFKVAPPEVQEDVVHEVEDELGIDGARLTS